MSASRTEAISEARPESGLRPVTDYALLGGRLGDHLVPPPQTSTKGLVSTVETPSACRSLTLALSVGAGGGPNPYRPTPIPEPPNPYHPTPIPEPPNPYRPTPIPEPPNPYHPTPPDPPQGRARLHVSFT
ncbi:unnamed protein product [Arctogadus glacialis]